METIDRTSGTSAEAQDIVHPESARVFVPLKIALDLAQELVDLSASLEGLAVRRVAPADIHLTLVRLWRETSILDAVVKLARIAEIHAPFELAIRTSVMDRSGGDRATCGTNVPPTGGVRSFAPLFWWCSNSRTNGRSGRT
jgi:2'-5' RNA ligase